MARFGLSHVSGFKSNKELALTFQTTAEKLSRSPPVLCYDLTQSRFMKKKVPITRKDQIKVIFVEQHFYAWTTVYYDVNLGTRVPKKVHSYGFFQ